MKCPQCDFENVPGQQRCFKCNSLLENTEIIDIYPPRMSHCKKPFRYIRRVLRSNRIPEMPKTSIATKTYIQQYQPFAMVLNIIPPLGYIIKGRFHEIKWLFLAWIMSLTISIFLYGDTLFNITFAIAVALHIKMFLDFSLKKNLTQLTHKIVAIIIIFLLLMTCYISVGLLIFRHLGLQRSSIAIPSKNIQKGDGLLTSLATQNDIKPGDIIIFKPYSIGQYQRQRITAFAGSNNACGQVIALPGQTLELKDNHFNVDGQTLDPNNFPIPNWLQNRTFYAKINDSSFFIAAEYNTNSRITKGFIGQACIVDVNKIDRRAYMIWSPIWRRSFIR